MYVPPFNEENDIAVLHGLIRSKPLGAWATMVDGEIVINHIPFLLDESKGEFGTLFGHVAKMNDIAHNFSSDIQSVVVFQGEQAYLTPSWYPSKHQHGKEVPTWNYTVVHAHGIPISHTDPEWLLAHVNALTNIHESSEPLPWKVSDAPEKFINNLTRAIVGIEIPITQLTGKWKLGQHKAMPEKLGIVTGMMSRDDPDSQSLGKQLQDRL